MAAQPEYRVSGALHFFGLAQNVENRNLLRVGHESGGDLVLFLCGVVFDTVEFTAVLAVGVLQANTVLIGPLDDEQAEPAYFGHVEGIRP